MEKRTNRVVWGLVVVLAAVLLLGAGVAVYHQLERRRLNNALVEASHRGDRTGVQQLLSRGADPNARAYAGMADMDLPALFLAADRGHAEVVQLLLGHGAFVDAKTDGGQTALSQAAGVDNTAAVVGILIAEGADVNSKDRSGMTPLHYACWRGQLTNVRLLVAAGADLNAKNAKGVTPLATALDMQRYASNKRLNYHKTHYQRHTEVVRLLKQAATRSTTATLADPPASIRSGTGR